MRLTSQVRTLTQGLTMAKKGPGRVHRQGLTVMQSSKIGLRIAQVTTLACGMVGKWLRYRDLVA